MKFWQQNPKKKVLPKQKKTIKIIKQSENFKFFVFYFLQVKILIFCFWAVPFREMARITQTFQSQATSKFTNRSVNWKIGKMTNQLQDMVREFAKSNQTSEHSLLGSVQGVLGQLIVMCAQILNEATVQGHITAERMSELIMTPVSVAFFTGISVGFMIHQAIRR